MMNSSIVVFVAAFAVMGLLLGVAASLDGPALQQEPEFQNTNGRMNNTSTVGIEEQVQVNVEKVEGQ